MRVALTALLVATTVLLNLAGSSPASAQQQRLDDPDLLKRGEAKGIYNRSAFPVLRRVDPFFISGDFNGDGGMDVAVWVENRTYARAGEPGAPGVAVIHSTLDEIRFFGAGMEPDIPNAKSLFIYDSWRLLRKGTVIRPLNSVREIGAVAGQSFAFRRDALEFGITPWGLSVAYYWANGKYWVVTTRERIDRRRSPRPFE